MPHFGEEIIMAKRKPDPSLAGQLDMFGILSLPVQVQSKKSQAHVNPLPANDVAHAISVQVPEVTLNTDVRPPLGIEDESVVKPSPKAKVLSTRVWLGDDWWTLSMVCAYLQVSRKTIWNRQRDRYVQFPQPVCMGSSRPRWRSAEVREWSGAKDSPCQG
jgi:predicted DNA-binding transcriptional regulator AlpA